MRRLVVEAGLRLMAARVCGRSLAGSSGVPHRSIAEPPAGEESGDEEDGTYDPEAAFTCSWPSADLIAGYRDECRRSDEVLAVTPLSAAPRGLGLHPDPEYTRQITNIRWIVMHVIEETAAHSGHLEIARELLDGKTRLGGR